MPAESSQFADALEIGGVDDDQLFDLGLVDEAKAHDGQALTVERDEFADVGVERACEDDAPLRVEQRQRPRRPPAHRSRRSDAS